MAAGAVVLWWQVDDEAELKESEDADDVPSTQPRARSAATLVVAAVTLLPQWETEVKRHAPKLTVLAYHGDTRKRVRRT